MTKEEFLSLKDHNRIKYIGTRPTDSVFGTQHQTRYNWGYRTTSVEDKCVAAGGKIKCEEICQTPKMPKAFAKQGLTVRYAYEHDKKLLLGYYGSTWPLVIDPAEWKLSDARAWVEGEAEYKRAKSYLTEVSRKFKSETKSFLQRYKAHLEYKLDNLPVDKKLKLLMELPKEDRIWFEILNTSGDDVVALLQKAFQEKLDECQTDEQPNSNPPQD